jgi:hypothetical protein
VPPRTVANGDKEKIRLRQTTTPESSNPALTPTANARTWQPGIDPDRYRYNLATGLTPTTTPQPRQHPKPVHRRERKPRVHSKTPACAGVKNSWQPYWLSHLTEPDHLPRTTFNA